MKKTCFNQTLKWIICFHLDFIFLIKHEHLRLVFYISVFSSSLPLHLFRSGSNKGGQDCCSA